MSMSHTDCDHPSTSKARAACRRLKNGAEAPRKEYKARKDKETKADRTERLNAKRMTAAKKAHPVRPTTEGCFECGSKAGWIDTKNGQPVCMKHVDYDRARIIPQ